MTAQSKALCTISTALILVLAGCASAPQYRINPSFEEKKAAIKTVAVTEPRVEIFEVSAGGVKEKVDEWSQVGAKNIRTAIERELASRSAIRTKTLSEASLSKEAKANLDDTYTLFDAVNVSVIQHTYGRPEFNFTEKIQNFDYSLGPEVSGITSDADALLLVYGVDHVSTAGRKALQGAAMVAGALLGVIPIPQSGPTAVIVALVDTRTGSILWYNLLPWGNFQDEVNVRTLVQTLLQEFPMR